jgi:hypothetical protein
MQKTIIAAVLAAVLAGALGFFGGVTYQKTQAPSFAGRSGQGGFPRQGGANGGLAANVVTGTVIAQDAQSITVKSANGGSKTVFISAQTQIDKQQVLKATDIKVGDEVGAFGQTANGGIDARTVQIIPPGGTFRFGGMGGRGGGAAGAPDAAPGTPAP